MSTRARSDVVVRNQRRAVQYFWLWLIIATSLSLAGNVAHAWLTAQPETRWLTSVIAVVPPLALLLSVHGLAVLAKSSASGPVYRTAVCATAAIAAGAFTISFVALRELAVIAGTQSTVAAVLPLVLDTSIAVCTLALVAVGDRPPRKSRSAPGAASAAATVSVSGAVSKRDTTRGQRDATATAQCGTESEVAAFGAEQSALDMAAEIAAQRITRQPVETVAAILTAHHHGDPVNRIAKQIGVHHSAVSRIIDAANELRKRELLTAG